MPRSHGTSVPPKPTKRPETFAEPRVGSGDRSSPAVESAEGYVEAIAALQTACEAMVEWVSIERLVAEQIIAHRQRIERVSIPKLQSGYAAAERVVDLERERARREDERARRLRPMRQVVAVTRIAA